VPLKLSRDVQFLIAVEECPRCGEDHASVLFTSLSNPENEKDLWGMCPADNQPILASKAEIGA
jgi:hypothetical protein